ncbi:MAG: FtsX-like permease family protein [Vicinamibacterales bacterium]
MLAYAVTIRRHEFGVRRALGADAARIIREVLGEGIGFAAVGCLADLVAALGAGPLLESQLYAVHPRDPLALGLALALILCGALAACWIPAYRATSIGPMDALRTE